MMVGNEEQGDVAQEGAAQSGMLLAPASACLERDLQRVIKQNGLVIWLDADGNYTQFAAGLAERAQSDAFPFPVVRFTGSFLELMLALENYGSGLYPEKVLVHMPGFNSQSTGERSIAETPLFELFKAGTSYQKALDTLLEEACVGVVRPEEGKRYRETKPTLEAANTWLTAAQSGAKESFLIGLEMQSPEALLVGLFSSSSRLAEQLKDARHEKQLLTHFGSLLGLPSDWAAFVSPAKPGDAALGLGDVRFVVASWLMAVEFVSDLREPPILAKLAQVQQLGKTSQQLCRALVGQMRSQFADDYRLLSGQFEDQLQAERQGHHAEALGSIDTFRFEETAVREAALSAVRVSNWPSAARFASERQPDACFWVKHDPRRERTWELIRLAADVGRQLEASKAGLQGCASLEEATNRYRDTLHRVDRSHRQFEQRFYQLQSTELEDEAALRDARDNIRQKYRQWADVLTAAFAQLCVDFGPLPSVDLRQCAVYEQFVHPLIERGQRVAFFLVDAMRYEMAEGLKEFFEASKYNVTLQARLAELPTVTEVGMNALAPVSAAGRLRPVVKDREFQGFRSGDQFTVRAPDDRVRAMESRSIGGPVSGSAIHLELAQVAEAGDQEVKRLLNSKKASPLIVVRSLELDEAGEKGFHLGTFEQTLVQIGRAVQRLQQAGIGNFVLAADHGFLLQDATAQMVEYKDGPKRRHVLSPQPSGMSDAYEVPLSALDYEVEKDAYLVFRRDTAVWKVKEKMAPFVHGGNSLQERVIPVLVLEKASKVGASTASYEVVATALPAEGGRERLELQVRLQRKSSGLLSFAGPKRISLALRVVGQDGVPLNVLPQLIDVAPPGEFGAGAILVPPSASAATVAFTIEGDTDEKVRVEVYHPDAVENVTPKIVEGWFNMRRNRRLGRPTDAPPPKSRRVPSPSNTGMAEQAEAARHADWSGGIEDEGFRRVFETIEKQESVNEEELQRILQNPRRVRAFARSFDELSRLVPFEVQVATLGGMKSYVKKDRK